MLSYIMSSLLQSILHKTPVNKFVKPSLDNKKLLFRQRLFEHVFPKDPTQSKVILLEAQAGQGKTISIHQLFQKYEYKTVWYQAGTEDRNPIHFLATLLTCFSCSIDNFSSSALISAINTCSIPPHDMINYLNIMLNDLTPFLQEPTFIIIEDVHIFEDAEHSCSLLAQFIDNSPAHLHFVLSSRHPVQLKSKSIYMNNAVHKISTEDLAFSVDETNCLLNSIFRKDFSPDKTLAIHRTANGWAMGIIFASMLPNSDDSSQLTKFAKIGRQSYSHLKQYCENEILNNIEKELHMPLMQLSFLDEISAELATKVTSHPTIMQNMQVLEQTNSFVTTPYNCTSTFIFHGLFKEFLQSHAQKHLAKKEIRQIYNQEVDFYLQKQNYTKVIFSLHKCQNYSRLDNLLEENGFHFTTHNNMIALLSIFKEMDNQTLFQYSWISLFAGIVYSQHDPQTGLPYLESSLLQFKAHKKIKGELTATAQLLSYQLFFSGNSLQGAELTNRLEYLYKKEKEQLGLYTDAHALKHLAAGYCFFLANHEKAIFFADKLQKTASLYNLTSHLAAAHSILGFTYLFNGDFNKCSHQIEACDKLLHHPALSLQNRLTIHLLQLVRLTFSGDLFTFRENRRQLETLLSDTPYAYTTPHPFIDLCQTSLETTLHHQAYHAPHLAEPLNKKYPKKTEELANQLLQWQSSITDITHKNRPPQHTAKNILNNLPGPFQATFLHLIKGSIQHEIGNLENAHTILSKTIQAAEQHSFYYLKTCGTLLRTLSQLDKKCQNSQQNLANDAKQTSSLIKKFGYTDFLLTKTHQLKQLSTLPEAEAIPTHSINNMQHQRNANAVLCEVSPADTLLVTMLDGFTISVNNKKLSLADLTSQQRSFICLLISSPNQLVTQEMIQLSIWPESSTERARKSSDALLDRLRKSLQSKLETNISDYLILQKGVLFLRNHFVDANELLSIGEKGFAAAQQNKWWEAGNYFRKAIHFWKGTLPTTYTTTEQSVQLEEKIIFTLKQIAHIWGNSLFQKRAVTQTQQIYEQIISVDRADQFLTGNLYKIYSILNKKNKCWELLDTYTKALKRYEYSDEEISILRKEVIDQRSPDKNLF